MRLWHYKLIPALPNKMLVSQWRECIAIKRQWEKGSLKHRLVSYIMKHDKSYFYNYVSKICDEMVNRGIKYNLELWHEITYGFCGITLWNVPFIDLKEYPEHNKKYLSQCFFNLEEKFDRGIITPAEFEIIKNRYTDALVEYYMES